MDPKTDRISLQILRTLETKEQKKTLILLEEKIEKLNFQTLSQLDPYLDKLLFKSKYAALHELDKASKIWHACEKAGPLFIIKRKIEPKYQFFLLNQKNNIDLQEEIFENMKIELKEEENFLFFQTNKQKILGLWFSEKDDLKLIFRIIQHLSEF